MSAGAHARRPTTAAVFQWRDAPLPRRWRPTHDHWLVPGRQLPRRIRRGHGETTPGDTHIDRPSTTIPPRSVLACRPRRRPRFPEAEKERRREGETEGKNLSLSLHLSVPPSLSRESTRTTTRTRV